MRGGKCLQCGFRGEGTAQMTREQRLNASKPKKTDDRGDSYSTSPDWSNAASSDFDVGGDCT